MCAYYGDIMSLKDAELAFPEFCEALLRLGWLVAAAPPPTEAADAAADGHLTEAEAAAGVAAALPVEEGAREAAAAEALRELLARLAAGWAGKSNKWASEPKFERRVASVRAALRKV